MGILIAIADIHAQTNAQAPQEIMELSLGLLLLGFLIGHMGFQVLYLTDQLLVPLIGTPLLPLNRLNGGIASGLDGLLPALGILQTTLEGSNESRLPSCLGPQIFDFRILATQRGTGFSKL